MIKEYLQRVYRFLVTIDSEPQVEQTVSIEEYNRVKQALEQANAKITSLTEVKEKKKDRDILEEGFRYDMIRHLHEGIYFKIEEDRNKEIESLAKSKMPIEEITWHLQRVREAQARTRTGTTKLPQKSIPEKTKDFAYVK